MVVVYDKAKTIPLPKTTKDVSITKLSKENIDEIVAIAEGISPNYANAYQDFVKELASYGLHVNENTYDSTITTSAIILAVSENYPFPGKSLDTEEQHKRLEILRTNNPKSIIINVALRDPYDAYLIRTYVDDYITSSGSNISNVKALAKLLAGRVPPSATLSVRPIAK